MSNTTKQRRTIKRGAGYTRRTWAQTRIHNRKRNRAARATRNQQHRSR
jgi:hypothetical protein